MARKEQTPDREQLGTLASALAKRFILRRDLYAKQLEDGSYICIREPLSQRDLISHLAGDITLGVYILDPNSLGEYLVFDADDQPDWRRLQALAGALAEQGTTSYLERSRRGGHLWLFFEQPLLGRDIRAFGRGLLGYFSIEGVEMFPKQDELTTGPGSLVRLPFGIHQKSGRRYGFYLPDGKPLAVTLREQILVLGDRETVQKDTFKHFISYRPPETDKNRYHGSKPFDRPTPTAEGAPVSKRIKAAISVREFVENYVELSEDGKGLCPFHDDHVASFCVNDEGNYWHCFACGTGGSIIDFWMQWRSCNFTEAVRELASILL